MTLLDQLTAPLAPEAPSEKLDRSRLEEYGDCPFAGAAVEKGLVTTGSPQADSGQAVHDVISDGIQGYVQDGVPPFEMMKAELPKARPDIQPDAIEGLQRSLWAISSWATDRHPDDFLAYDGGQGERSGQRSWEILPAIADRPAVLATSEIDVLVATPSPQCYHEIDWKTGQERWTPTKVKNAFQFNLHAWLVFRNWPDVEQVDIQVWMTRMNQRTPLVPFRRGKGIDDFTARLQQIVEWRRTFHKFLAEAEEKLLEGKPTEQATLAVDLALHPEDPKRKPIELCWNRNEQKCLRCDALSICPAAHKGAWRIGKDPGAFVRAMILRRTAWEKDREIATTWVAEHGPIDIGNGQEWRITDPKERKITVASYGVCDKKAPDNGTEADHGQEDQ